MHDGSGPGQLLAVFCANVIHIAPWRVAEGLFAGAARYLRADGRLFLYGPFKRDGKHTALSNAVFDTSLRDRDAEWGVRDIDGFGKAGGERRSWACRDRRDAGQQSDAGVRAVDVRSRTELTAAVIASEAKQSILFALPKLDGFASLAMTLIASDRRRTSEKRALIRTHTPRR